MTSTRRASALAAQASMDVRITAGRLRRRLIQVAGEDELSSAQASVLARLAQGTATSPSELAALEGVRPQSMTAIVTALEGSGLVTRSPDPRDGRRQLLTLTRAGREHYQGQRAARQEWLSRRLSDALTDQDLQLLISAMSVLNRVIDE